MAGEIITGMEIINGDPQLGVGIEGDGSDKLVLRKVTLLMQNGSNAATIKPWVLSTWNGDTIAEENNLAKDGDTGNFALNSDGDTLHIQSSGFSANVVAVLSAILFANASGSAMVLDGYVSSNGIKINFSNPTTAASLDTTTLVDTGVFNLYIVYITDG